MPPDDLDALVPVFDPTFARGREAGSIGTASAERLISHSLGFAEAIGDPPGSLADLGSGGGVPALVLAYCWPGTQVTMIESQLRRVRHLRAALDELGIAAHLRHARAEDVAREMPEHFAVVTARSFGPPAAVAECAAPLLEVGGRLVVSEPPDDPGRWPAEPLRDLGLAPAVITTARHGTATFAVITKRAPTPDRYPRRTAALRRRPLW